MNAYTRCSPTMGHGFSTSIIQAAEFKTSQTPDLTYRKCHDKLMTWNRGAGSRGSLKLDPVTGVENLCITVQSIVLKDHSRPIPDYMGWVKVTLEVLALQNFGLSKIMCSFLMFCMCSIFLYCEKKWFKAIVQILTIIIKYIKIQVWLHTANSKLQMFYYSTKGFKQPWENALPKLWFYLTFQHIINFSYLHFYNSAYPWAQIPLSRKVAPSFKKTHSADLEHKSSVTFQQLPLDLHYKFVFFVVVFFSFWNSFWNSCLW